MNNVQIVDWLNSLSAKQPTPGGGAVAALSAGIAAAQLQMVAEYTTGPKWQDRETRMQELSAELVVLRNQALELVDADAKAFEAVGSVYGLPKETESDKSARKQAIQQALVAAAVPPSKTAKLCEKLAEIATELAESGNPNVISDVAVGASMIRASLESAIVNIEINQYSLDDEQIKQSLQTAVQDATQIIKNADAVVAQVRDGMKAV